MRSPWNPRIDSIPDSRASPQGEKDRAPSAVPEGLARPTTSVCRSEIKRRRFPAPTC